MMFLLLVLWFYPVTKGIASSPVQENIPTAMQVVEAVNALRLSVGLSPLMVHPALMQVAQIGANGIANGMPGHWRPDGLTLGQWLISLGYPLAGDLSLDGYRSENWIASGNVQEAIQAWKGDGEHSNTMLSAERNDIGVGIAVGDQVYIVLVTALQTSSGQMQPAAYPLLTQIASFQSGTAVGSMISQYMNPVVLSTARPNGDVIHKIQYGQSLWSIAIAYHTTIDQIRAWNNLEQATTVYEGQVLLVQRNATQPPPVTPTPEAIASPTASPTAPARNTVVTQPATIRSTLTNLPAEVRAVETTSPAEDSPGLRLGIIVMVAALGGFIGMLLVQRSN